MNENLQSYIMNTYGVRTLEFVKGEGAYLTSTENKKYLDFGSGIAVNSLGHCHPSLVEALQNQSSKLWHTSNLYLNSHQEEYAKILCQNSFAEKIFFTNSGVESIECGLKVIRSYHHHCNQKNKKNIITFENGFHGRTLAAISTQHNKKLSSEFEPLLPGFIQSKLNDLESLKQVIDENTAAIMIEPIQGEGGVKPANLDFLKDIKKICEDLNILFFLDEVQTGFGRSGKLFAYEWSNVEPDVMAVAKGIGSGFPLGACFATNKSCVGMIKGMHGSTFGGNSLAVSVGLAVINEILKEGFLKKVDNISRYLWNKLKLLEKKFSNILEIRGAGLLLGIKTKTDHIEISNLLIKNGLLNVPAKDSTIRLAPPLIITEKEVDEALIILEKTFGKIND